MCTALRDVNNPALTLGAVNKYAQQILNVKKQNKTALQISPIQLTTTKTIPTHSYFGFLNMSDTI